MGFYLDINAARIAHLFLGDAMGIHYHGADMWVC